MSRAHREYFNQIAPEWNSRVPLDSSLQEHLIRFGVSSGDRVLDVGAGTGRTTLYLTKLVGPQGLVVAEDIAEQMLFEAKQSLGHEKTVFLCADVCALSLKEDFFDKVVCFSAFPHISHPLSALREMYRVLRPEGKLLILHSCSSQKLNQFHASLNSIVSQDILLSIYEMVPLLDKAGLKVKEMTESENIYWIEAVKDN